MTYNRDESDLIVSVSTITELNKSLVIEFGGIHSILKPSLLESVSAGVNQEVFGVSLYPTLRDKISYMVASVAKNHIFGDGNKRTASYLYMTLADELNLPYKTGYATQDIILKIVANKFDVAFARKLLF